VSKTTVSVIWCGSYAKLDIEEDFFVNYGFLPRSTQALMHPRTACHPMVDLSVWLQAQAVLAYVAERAVVHPREVDAHFAHGSARNWFGGTSRASTQLLDDMHYRGMLRIAGRVGGVRTYAARQGTAGRSGRRQSGGDHGRIGGRHRAALCTFAGALVG
jgi:uncharacterized protein YcaQ